MPRLEIVIDGVVAPFDQRYDAKPPGADNVAESEAPQSTSFDAVMTGAGVGLTLTTTGALVAEQPFASVVVTL